MKNIIGGILIFLVMLIGILFSINYLNNTCNTMINSHNKIEKLILKEDWQNAYKSSLDILNDSEKHYKKLTMFTHHEQIDEINNELLQLTQYIKCKNKPECLSKIHIIKFLLNNIIDGEKVNLQNVF